MKKHTYIQPSVVMVKTELQTIVCVSGEGVTGTGTGSGIEYGGVDDGTKKPSIPRRRTVWDAEEDELLYE